MAAWTWYASLAVLGILMFLELFTLGRKFVEENFVKKTETKPTTWQEPYYKKK